MYIYICICIYTLNSCILKLLLLHIKFNDIYSH